MKNIVLNNVEYELTKNIKDAFNYEEVIKFCTDYFIDFDYILGDYSYGHLRLKGFYNNSNKKVTEINNFNNIDNYIENYCAYECGYFILYKTNKIN